MNNSYKIIDDDPFTVRQKLGELAKGYTPEWAFSTENPCAGSVLALIFADQMTSNRVKINQTLNKYRTEFVNMLELSLKPPTPAHSIVEVSLIEEASLGIDVPKGTKLMGPSSGEEGSDIIFETLDDLYVTPARLTDIIEISATENVILPIMGSAVAAEIIKPQKDEDEEEEIELEEPLHSKAPFNIVPAFSFLDFDRPGIQQNGLLFYHKNLFDVSDKTSIYFDIRDERGLSLADKLTVDGTYRWSYYATTGLVPFEKVTSLNKKVELRKQGESKKIAINGEKYTLVYLEALKPVKQAIEVSYLTVSAESSNIAPELVFGNDMGLNVSSFKPFGDIASIYAECFIANDDIFAQGGANITLTCTLTSEERYVDVSVGKTLENLKVIKRKARIVQYETVYTSPTRVAVEYYNGLGWKNLGNTNELVSVFDGTHSGEMKSSFVVPEDWKPLVIGGMLTRALRMRIIEADNCYLRPCIHNMPIISNLLLSFSYANSLKKPQIVQKVHINSITDITKALQQGQTFEAFSIFPYIDDALYLGFDKQFTNGPIKLMLDIPDSSYFGKTAESSHYSGAKNAVTKTSITFMYSTIKGFRELRVIDGTEGLTHGGVLTFMPPSDFAMLEISEVKRYYLKIVENDERYNPTISNIILNACEIANINTRNEEIYYLDGEGTGAARNVLSIAVQNILDANVYVDEKSMHTKEEMAEMQAKSPELLDVIYDFLGNIAEFYVKWEEVENFSASTPNDRHYVIDRRMSKIFFGDGIRGMNPSKDENATVKLQVRTSEGKLGNVPKNTINDTFRRLLYVESVNNPFDCVSGCDIETNEKAYLRGANLISSRNRLVSSLDFINAAKEISGSIARIRCIVGDRIDGGYDDRLVSIVILMEDYKSGAFSFNAIKNSLRNHLLERCAGTLTTLVVTPPIYVEITLDVWINTNKDAIFEIQNDLLTAITNFIDPLGTTVKPFTEIGTLPTYEAIGLLLTKERTDVVIKCFTATGCYRDKNGTKTVDLRELKVSPFMVAINGKHSIKF